jgi:dTMP kinase
MAKFGYLDNHEHRSDDMLITFEGTDCSGKSTQARMLLEWLEEQKREVLFLREPGGTAISENIRELLLDAKHPELTRSAEILLFSAARAQLVSQVIRPALEKGTIVLCDRFYDSTTAYQGYGRGLPLEDVTLLNRLATTGLVPDLTVLVDVTLDEAARRREAAGQPADRMESAGRAFFERVRAGYHAMAHQEPTRWVVLDGMRPVEAIQSDIRAEVTLRLSH